MTTTREEVIESVMLAFGGAERVAALATLDVYGREPHERERERVQLALVKLAAGDLEALSKLVRAAKQDYRDVLCWAHTGPLSAKEGLQLQAAARLVIERWGNG